MGGRASALYIATRDVGHQLSVGAGSVGVKHQSRRRKLTHADGVRGSVAFPSTPEWRETMNRITEAALPSTPEWRETMNRITEAALPSTPEWRETMNRITEAALPSTPEWRETMNRITEAALPSTPEWRETMNRITEAALPSTPEWRETMNRITEAALRSTPEWREILNPSAMDALWESVRSGTSPSAIAAAIEPTAPTVAERMRSLLDDPVLLAAYITVLLTVLQLVVSVVGTIHGWSQPTPTTPGVVNQTANITNVETTNVTNLPSVSPNCSPPPHSRP